MDETDAVARILAAWEKHTGRQATRFDRDKARSLIKSYVADLGIEGMLAAMEERFGQTTVGALQYFGPVFAGKKTASARAAQSRNGRSQLGKERSSLAEMEAKFAGQGT